MAKLLLVAFLYFISIDYFIKNGEAADPLTDTVQWMTTFRNLLGPSGLDIKQTAELVSGMSKAIGILGPAGQIFSFALDSLINEKKEDKIFKEFTKLHERFDEVEKKLKRIDNKIAEESAFNSYERDVLIPKRALLQASQFYESHPENSTMKDFRDTCKAPGPLKLISNIAYLAVEDNLGATLFKSFYTNSNFDRRRLHEYVFTVMGDLIETGVLAELCAHVDPSKPSKDLTDKYAQTVQEVAQKIEKEFKKFDDQLLKEWIDQAQKEFKEAVKKYNKASERYGVAQPIHDDLAKKYYWVGFYVNVYGYHDKDFWETRASLDTGKTYKSNSASAGFIQYDNDEVKKSALLAWRDKANKALPKDWRDKARAAAKSWEDDGGCSRSSVSAKDSLDESKKLRALDPSWIYLIYRPGARYGREVDSHGQVYDNDRQCYGRIFWHNSPDDYQQQVIIGWN